MIKVIRTQGLCCGSQGWVFTLPTAIKKEDANKFEEAGWKVQPHYLRSNIFQAQLKGFIATGAIGSTKLTCSCPSKDCSVVFQSFQNLVEKIFEEKTSL